MTTSAAQRTKGANAKNGATYWAIFTRIPSRPIVSGSHYGARVDCAIECDGLHGHVWSSEATARERLATLPTNYSKDGIAGAGAPIGREVGRVLFHSGGYFYDVVSTPLEQLRPGDRVNVGTLGGGDYWQTIASIEYVRHVGGRAPYSHHAGGRAGGADVYAVTWREVIATDPNAAPSLLSSRQRYDVLRMDY